MPIEVPGQAPDPQEPQAPASAPPRPPVPQEPEPADSPVWKALGQLAGQQQGQLPATFSPPAVDPTRSVVYQLLEQQAKQQEQDLLTSFRDAVRTDPNRAAEAQRAARQLGLSTDFAAANPQQVKQILAQQALERRRLAGDSPILMRMLEDREFAKVAHDAVFELGFLENITAQYEAGWLTIRQGRLALRRMDAGGELSPAEQRDLDAVTARLRQLPRTSGGFVGGLARTVFGQGAEMVFGEGGVLKSAIAGGATGATYAFLAGGEGPQGAVTVPAGFLVGASVAAGASYLSQTFAVEAGHQYQDLRELGYDHATARTAAIVVGLANMGLEAAGGELLLGGVARRLFGRELAEGVTKALLAPRRPGASALRRAAEYGAGVGGEVLTEVAQEWNNVLAEQWAARGARKDGPLDTPEGRAGVVERLSGIAVETIYGVGLIGALRPIADYHHDVRRAKDAIERQQPFLQAVAKATESNPVTERAPERVAQLLNEKAAGSEVEHVYLEAEKLDSALQQAGVSRQELAQKLPEVAKQLPDALASGGDVVIPIGDYTAHLAAPESIGPLLQPHARLGEDAFSAAEAEEVLAKQKELAESAQGEAAKILAEDEQLAESARVVEEDVLRQLRAVRAVEDNVARDQAAVFTSFIVVQAREEGVTPEAFYARYRLQVVGEGRRTAAQGEVGALQQPAIDSDAFKAWFGDSKVVDEHGKPLRVYHGTETPGFHEFAKEERGRNTGAPSAGRGFFFARNAATAESHPYVGVRMQPTISALAKADALSGQLRKLWPQAWQTAKENADNPKVGSVVRTLQLKAKVDPDGNWSGHDQQRLQEAVIGTEQWRDAYNELLDALGDVAVAAGLPRLPGLSAKETASLWVETGQQQERQHEEVPNGGVYSVFLAIRNPLIHDFKSAKYREVSYDSLIAQAQREGHDGVILRNTEDGGPVDDIYVAFEPTQIKSATGNRGTFDPNDPSILQQPPRAGLIGTGADGPRGEFLTRGLTVVLREGADLSTFLHESAHYYLTVLASLASRDDATARQKADFDALLRWFGVADAATWHAMTEEQQAKFHEQFAYNFEVYMAEGKAPSLQLEGVFQRFKRWLRQLYGTVRDVLNPKYRERFGEDLPLLTGEVRSVMDRMLANSEEIRQAEEARGMQAVFQSREEAIAAGMDPDAYDTMRESQQWAHEEAAAEMDRRSLRTAHWEKGARVRIRKSILAKAREEREKLREQVTPEVAGRPEFRARELLTGSQKLDRQVVAAMLPERGRAAALKRLQPFLSDKGKPGLRPDDVADLVGLGGMGSGQALLRDLAQGPTLDEAIEQRVDQRLGEEHPELVDPKEIDAAVEQALHSEARGRHIAAGIAMLERGRRPFRILNNAAKLEAQRQLRGRPISQIRHWEFTAAERRHGREALRQARLGNVPDAIRAMHQQLLQQHLAAEAIRAKDEVDRARRRFEGVWKSDKDHGKAGRIVDYVKAAQQLLTLHGLGAIVDRATPYLETVKALNPGLYEELEAVFRAAQANPRNWRQLTLEEFRELRDAVTALMFQARRARQVKVEGEMVALEQAVTESAAQLRTLPRPAVAPGSTREWTTREAMHSAINGIGALLRRIENWCWTSDGGKAGPLTRYLWRPIKDAIVAYRAMRNVYVKRYVDMLGKLKLKNERIDAPMLGPAGYSFRNQADLIGAVMHGGNDSNLGKNLAKRGWVPDPQNPFLPDSRIDRTTWDAFMAWCFQEGHLTKEIMDFVQATWDLNEELKPLSQAAHHDLYGYYWQPIEATPVQTPWGVYRGGYVPAKADRQVESKATKHDLLDELERNQKQQIPSTRKGHTITRTDVVRALSHDIRLIAAHIDEVILFAHLQPRVREVQRIIESQEFSAELARIDPQAEARMLIPWLARAASQGISQAGINPTMDQFARAIRSRSGMGTMFAYLSNALQQVTGLFLSSLRVPWRYLRPALWETMRGAFNRSANEKVARLSPFMANRQESQIHDINESLRLLAGDGSRLKDVQSRFRRKAYFLQTWFQNLVDTVTWLGAYNHALDQIGAQVGDEAANAEAVQRADAQVRMTQGSLEPEDVAGYQAGTPWSQVFTQFSGYFNTLAQLQVDEFQRAVRDLGWKGGAPRLCEVYLLGFFLPMAISDAIARAVAGQWDDEDDDGYGDEFAEWFFTSQLRGLGALVPVFGPAASQLAVSQLTAAPYDDRMSTAPAIRALEAATFGVVRAVRSLSEGELTGRNVRDVATLLDIVLGLPATAVARPVAVAVDEERGATKATSGSDWVRALLSGRASEDARR